MQQERFSVGEANARYIEATGQQCRAAEGGVLDEYQRTGRGQRCAIGLGQQFYGQINCTMVY
ncbi:MAG: hypothetical protein JSW21_05820 [Gammaproteobacteria bacterium]|jgi:hypothetical protein|nr:MAG: hypothetical protein JSW21_05820 [Gammaproteobacteria bacterium]